MGREIKEMVKRKTYGSERLMGLNDFNNLQEMFPD